VGCSREGLKVTGDGGSCSGLAEAACIANSSCAADYCSPCGCTPAPFVGCRDQSADKPKCLQAPCPVNACGPIDMSAPSQCQTANDCAWGEIDHEILSRADCICLFGCPYI